MKQTVVVLSGGLDSATLLYQLREAGHGLKALTIDYGQRHSRELVAAQEICNAAGVEHRIVDLSGMAVLFGGNALTDHSVPVPHGEYAPPTMAVTTVPNRNMIMLSIATGWAIALEFDSVAFGAHAGEYTPYPDCQPAFANAMHQATQVCDHRAIELLAPFITWTKADIVARGRELGVPFELTWSCYQGGDRPCRACSTCLDRAQAFAACRLRDPVLSDDGDAGRCG